MPSVTYPKISITPCESRFCWEYQTKITSAHGIEALPVMALIYLKINNQEFRLDHLVNSGDASLRIKNSEIIQLKINNNILKKIPSSSGLTISFSTRSSIIKSCEGKKYCESPGSSCERFLIAPPTCEDSGNYEGFSIIDRTIDKSSEVSGETFFSIEYI